MQSIHQPHYFTHITFIFKAAHTVLNQFRRVHWTKKLARSDQTNYCRNSNNKHEIKILPLLDKNAAFPHLQGVDA